MKRDELTALIERTIEEVICLAEEKSGKTLQRKYAFRWLGRWHPTVSEDVADHIAKRVFVDEEHIYPCVDIGVGDMLDDGSLLIVGNVAGYAPRPFGPNWTGRMGPFVHIVGQPFLNKIAGEHTEWSEDNFTYIIPDMKKLKMQHDWSLSTGTWPDLIERIRARTPARVLVERAGAGYRTGTQLELRQAHAAARDAVRTELHLQRDFGDKFINDWQLFEVATQAVSKDEYLLHPDLGRNFTHSATQQIQSACLSEADLQIVIGDGLSVTAVIAQVPALLPLIGAEAKQRGWKLGRPFVVRHCRVGIMNHVGELLRPEVVVLLIGERPGLATAESLSAYMAFRPRSGDNDARRNLISNIHSRGVPVEQAASRIMNLAAQMKAQRLSGVQLKESLESPQWLRNNPADKALG